MRLHIHWQDRDFKFFKKDYFFLKKEVTLFFLSSHPRSSNDPFHGQINIIMNINWPDLHWQDNAISLRSSSHYEKHFYESDTPPPLPQKSSNAHIPLKVVRTMNFWWNGSQLSVMFTWGPLFKYPWIFRIMFHNFGDLMENYEKLHVVICSLEQELSCSN